MMRSIQGIMARMGTLAAFAQPGLNRDLPGAFGNLWDSVEAFKIEGPILSVVSAHPAFHWSVRMRRKEIMDQLKIYGVKELCLRRKI